MKMKTTRRAQAPADAIASTIEQLDGVLICVIAACDARGDIPAAITSAIFTAARLSSEARRQIGSS
jgi:hypothetical protein